MTSNEGRVGPVRLQRDLIKLLIVLSVVAGCGSRSEPPLPQSKSPDLSSSNQAGIENTSSSTALADDNQRPRQQNQGSLNAPAGSSQAKSTEIARAEEALISGNLKEARRHATSALLKQPSDANALFLMAQIQAQSDDIDQALATLREIPIDEPNFGLQAAGQSADWLASLGRHFDAKALYERLMDRAGSNEMFVRHRYADFLNHAGWRIEAKRILVPVVESREATEQELRGLLNNSTEFMSTLPPMVWEPSSPRRGPISLAIGYMVQGSPRDTIKTLLAAIKSDKSNRYANDPTTLSLLASAYAEIQKWNEAATLLTRVAPSDRWHPSYWLAYGDWFQDQNQSEDALRCYEKAIQMDPTCEIAHERLIASLVAQGQTEAANKIDDRRFRVREAFKTSRGIGENSPSDIDASKDLIKDLVDLNESTQAIAWLSHLIQRHPEELPFASEIRTKIKDAKVASETVSPLSGWLAGYQIPQKEIEDPSLTLKSLLEQSKTEVTLRSPQGKRLEVVFADVAKERGLVHQYLNDDGDKRIRLLKMHQQFGGGIAALDYDLDGAIDLHCGQGAGSPPELNGKFADQLFRQLRSGTDIRYVNVAEIAGVNELGFTLGITAGDINQDGFPDLAIGNLGQNRLYINQGDGTFRDASFEVFTRDNDFTMGLAIADITGDQLNDIVEINYVDDEEIYEEITANDQGIPLRTAGPLMFRAALDRTWISDEVGHFVEKPLIRPNSGSDTGQNSAELGDSANPSLGLIVTDFNSQPGLEIFVANDLRPNHYWVKTESVNAAGESEFHEQAVVSGLAFSSRGGINACMGVAFADFDANGLGDLIVTNWIDEWVNFFRQTTPGVFRDSAPHYGLDEPSEGALGFGTQPIDFDNDSFVDLVITNGHIDDMAHLNQPQFMPTQLLVSNGSKFELADPKGPFWDKNHLGRCLIRLDHNSDGKMDFAVSDLNDPVALLENQTLSPNGWIQFEIVGTSVSRIAIGTHVSVTAGDSRWTQTTATGDGFEGRNETIVHFGLGDSQSNVNVELTWPDGSKQSWNDLVPNQRYLLIENELEAWPQDDINSSRDN
ncbi:tetratricopeptide repeat protein [Rubripirellula amarantea]|uniref:Tetratricopeptide repeat protein n=1 Tax=Rubripirellula amarantea TaxID=2527999 RepID=A0A5C5WQ72_9BACT|nr:FG-GAP-like repeat-containing protein [Rubripirellula amarantea]TWT52926.1 tetratricopeptide repeat protein [Rubripirellula amarantea]